MRRSARAAPELNVAQIARQVGCHPSTVRKHLRTMPLPGSPAAVRVEAASLAQLQASTRHAGTGRCLKADAGTRGDKARSSRDPVLLARLADDPAVWVCVGAAGNPATPTQALARLAAAAWTPHFERGGDDLALRVAANPGCSPRLLARLAAASPKLEIRAAAAANPGCPPLRLGRLAGSRTLDLRRAVAANPSTPAAALAALAGDINDNVRQDVAANPSCPPAVADRLAGHPDPWTRDNVTRRADVTAAALASAAAAGGWTETLRRVAGHRNSGPAVFETLAGCEDEWVRASAAGQAACPVGVLRQFAHDSARIVRCSAARNANCPPAVVAALAGDADSRVRESAASAVNLPGDALDRLAADSVEDVRRFAAMTAKTLRDPDSVAVDSDRGLRCYAARHPRCPPRLLAALSADKDHDVAMEAVSHSDCPPAALRTAAAAAKTVRHDPAASFSAIRNADKIVERVAAHPRLEPANGS